MKHVRTWALVILAAFAILLPLLIGDPTWTSLGVYILLFACAATAWNIFSGFTNYINLGAAFYVGIGSYTMAILCQDWNIQGGWGPFFLLPLAGLFAAFCSVPLGLLALRLRRYAFIVMTIAIFYIGQYLAYNLDGLTNGATGIFLPNPPWDASTFDLPFYYIAFVLLILAILASWWVRYSKYGLGLLAIRDDEDRALSLGVHTGFYKLGAYILSSFFTGMVGAVLAYYSGTAYPYSGFNTNFNIMVNVLAFAGGLGTIFGPMIGALLLMPLQQFVNTQFGAEAANFGLIIFGTILLLTVLLLPAGIAPALSKYRKQWLVRIDMYQLFKPILWPVMNNSSAAPAGSLNNKWDIAEVSDSSSSQIIPVESSLYSPGHTTYPVSQSVLAAPEISVHSAGSRVLQEMYMQNDGLSQSGKHVALNIPRRHAERPLTDTEMIETTRLKAQRLVPVIREGSDIVQDQANASIIKSWRCPDCRRPFLLKGGQCYCPKCGLTRPLVG